MFKKIGVILLFAASLNSFGVGVIHDGKKVSAVQAAITDCVYFKLEGVNTADSTVNESDWFAVPAESDSKEEILSIAMAAFAANLTVRVSTSGSNACGYAEAKYIRLIK